MRVIIADDEIHIVRLIHHLIDWDGLGLECVGCVTGGTEVLALLERDGADIVITDIEMPEMNGLELIEQAKAVQPECQFIIISGFRNFDYAKQAITFGVSEYILKPINREELNAALRTLIGRRSSEAVRKDSYAKALRQSFAPMLEARQRLDMQQVNREYGYHFRQGLYRCMKLLYTGTDCDEQVAVDVRALNERLKLNLQKITCEVECYPLDVISWVFLVNYPEAENAAFISRVNDFHKELRMETRATTRYEVYLGVGRAVDALEKSAESLTSAAFIIFGRFSYGADRAYFADFISYDEAAGENIMIDAPDRLAFMRSVETVDVEKAGAWIEGFFGNHEAEVRRNPALASVLAKKIIDLLIGTLEELHTPVADPTALRMELELRVNHQDSLPGVLGVTQEMVQREMTSQLGGRKSNPSIHVQYAKDYIDLHYASDISLEKSRRKSISTPSTSVRCSRRRHS